MLATSLVLTGCATAPVSAPPQAARWSGKLGYRLEASDDERAQAGSARFVLEGDALAGRLDLSSPLGTTLAAGNWDASGLRLFDGERTLAYPDLGALGAALGERLGGTPLPLAALFDWLAGRPSPTLPHTPTASGFEQAGWQVELAATRLRLRRERLTLTLLLSED